MLGKEIKEAFIRIIKISIVWLLWWEKNLKGENEVNPLS